MEKRNARQTREIVVPGAFTGGLTAASGGIAASLIFGVLAAAVGKSRDQN